MWDDTLQQNGDSMIDWFAAFDLSSFPFPELRLYDTINLKATEAPPTLTTINEDYIRELELHNVLGRELTA